MGNDYCQYQSSHRTRIRKVDRGFKGLKTHHAGLAVPKLQAFAGGAPAWIGVGTQRQRLTCGLAAKGPGRWE